MFKSFGRWLGMSRIDKRCNHPKQKIRLGLEALEAREVPAIISHRGANLYETVGSQQLLIDTGVENYAVMNNEVYDIHITGSAEKMGMNGSGKSQLPITMATQLTLADNGADIFFLTSQGYLYSYTVSEGFQRQVIGDSSGVAQLVCEGYTAFALMHDDTVWQANINAGTWGEGLLGGMTQLMLGDSGSTVFALECDGRLYSANASHNWEQESIGDGSGVSQFVSDGYTDFALMHDGTVWQTNINAGTWGEGLLGGMTQLMLGDSGSTVFALECDGRLYSANASHNWEQESIGDGSGVSQFVSDGYTDFALMHDGTVWQTNINAGTWGEGLLGGVTQLVKGDNGYTVYALQCNGCIYSTSLIHNWALDNTGDASGVAQLVVGDDGHTEFALMHDGNVQVTNINNAGAWGSYWGSTVTQLVVGDNGYTTFFLTSGGSLFGENDSQGFGQENMGDASGVAQLVVGDDGHTEFALMHDGNVQVTNINNTGAWGSYWGSTVTQLVVGDNGYTTFFLTSGGSLFSENDSQGFGQENMGDASGVAQLVVGDDGHTEFALMHDGNVQVTNINNTGAWGSYWGSTVTQLVVGDNGYTTFFLTSGGSLFSENDSQGFGQENMGDASGVAQLVVGDDGHTEFALMHDGNVQVTNINNAGAWGSYWGSTVTQLVVGDNGYTTFFLTSGGSLFGENDSQGFGQENMGDASGVAQLVVGDDGHTEFALMHDGNVQVTNINNTGAWGSYWGSTVTQLVVGDNGYTTFFLTSGGSLFSENDSQGFALTASNIGSLQRSSFGYMSFELNPITIQGNFAGQYMSASVVVPSSPITFTYKLISGNLPTGMSLSGVGVLSGTPLYAGSYTFTVEGISTSSMLSSTQTVTLNVKAISPNPTAIDDSTDQGIPYTPVPSTDTLFGPKGRLPSCLDVSQGAEGDCWLIASLAEVAARDPQDIVNMFTYDGPAQENGSLVGVYTVRFYTQSGSPEYVAVDTELPDGGGYYDHPINGVLWVALAEKAYVVANNEAFVQTDHGGNSYDVLGNQDNSGGDPRWALQAITGQPSGTFDFSYNDIVNAWNSGKLIVLNTGSNLMYTAEVPDHSYAVVGYNATKGEFELMNPWGADYLNNLGKPVPLTSTSQMNPNQIYYAPGNYNGYPVYGLFGEFSYNLEQCFDSESFGVGLSPSVNGNTDPHQNHQSAYAELQFYLDADWNTESGRHGGND